MLSVERHIAYLVTRHDCVIVPGLGAFVSLYTPASYNEATATFLPPARRLGFNPEVNHNDAMLAASIARREAVSYDRAAEVVKTEVESWIRQLDTTGTFAIEGLGAFTRGSSQQLIFEPSPLAVANHSYAGLPQLAGLADLASRTQAGDDEVAPVRTAARFSRHVIRAAASVAIIVTILATVLTSVLRPDSPLYYASLFPTAPAAESVPDYRPIATPSPAELRIATAAEEALPSRVAANPPASTAKSDDTSHRYFLVVASLANQKEVDRYFASMPAEQSATLRVLHGQSRYRVYAASGSSFAEANAARSQGNFATLYPDAWVYVRH